MAKYRKKTVVIEAVQFKASGESFQKIIDMGLKNWRPGPTGAEMFYIETLEGEMEAKKNDWIIKGVSGEFYPCKPDIFEKTYEKVEDAE